MRIRRSVNAGPRSMGVKGAAGALVAPLLGVVAMLAGFGLALAPAGSAGATPPSQGWTSTQAPLPNDAGSGGGLPYTYLASSACPAANACMTAGWYEDSSSHAWGLFEQQNGTSWTDTEAPQPNDAGSGAKQGLWIGSQDCGYDIPCRAVSCPTTTFCIAVGSYNDSGGASGYKQPLIETLANGSWSAARAPLPGDAATDAGPVFPDALLFSVTCVTTTSCVAVGQYRNTSGDYLPLAATLSGTTWSASLPGLPSGVAPTTDAVPPLLTGVACPLTWFCMASGTYHDSGGHLNGLIDGLGNGTWTPITAPEPGDAGVGSNQNASLSQVVCTTGTACTTVGFYSVTTGASHGLIDVWNGATWTPTGAPEPAGTRAAQLGAVSCPTPTFCVTVGQYEDSNNKYLGLIDTLSGGTWTGASAPQPTAVPAADQYAFLWELNCPTPNYCLVAGEYENASAKILATALTYSAGSWSAALAPVPANAGGDSYGRTVACDSPVACVFGGQYFDQSGDEQGYLDTWTGPQGYWLDASDGGIFSYPNNAFYGSTGGIKLNKPMVGMATTADGQGYWLVASDGGIFSYGDATFHGSRGGQPLNEPIVGMAATADGGGYWLVASDGGIFSYGDAGYYGSRGGQPINAPIVSMATTPDGKGYWLVGADGGIYNYGDASFLGSAGALHLNAPVVGMAATPDGLGYWLVASDGGIFNYGDGNFYGSTGALKLNKPVVGMSGSPSGRGYWLVASDGGIFNYGDATFQGSAGALHLNAPVVGMAGG